LREFRKDAIQWMSYNPDDNSDPRNQIRKCYHCEEIWIKVEGCDGITNCGNREWDEGWIDSSSTNTMKSSGAIYKFNFKDQVYLGFQKITEFLTSLFVSTSEPELKP
jgi:hypothetical protein